MTFLIPEPIETPRLRLRAFCEEDLPALHEYYADPECARYTTGHPLSEDESREMLQHIQRHWQRKGYGPYAVEDSATSSVLGIVGLYYPKEWPEPEIKWGLIRRYWGRGYAAEAARAVAAMAARHLPELHLISLIHRHNLSSIQLARALGAVFEREMPFRGDIYHVYRHSRAGAR